MDYIWEYFTYDSHPTSRLQQAESFSPYTEITSEVTQENDGGSISYNAMLRYNSVFGPLFSSERLRQKKELFDVFSRFLIEQDLRSGVSVNEYKRRAIARRMLAGEYGEKTRDLYKRCSDKQQYQLAHFMLLAEETDCSDELFTKACLAVLDGGTIYRDSKEPDVLLLYVGRNRSVEDETAIELLEVTLLPFSRKCKVLWNTHFGVINEAETMQIGSIVVV